MFFVKGIILFLVFCTSSFIGFKISNKYVDRLRDLKKAKSALNFFKAKVLYTYDTVPQIFEEVSKKVDGEVGEIFLKASRYMNFELAGEAWEKSISESECALIKDDRVALNSLGKLLGSTDIDGQVGQIELVEEFINQQINEAENLKNKNAKMYKKLGIIIGMVIVIVLI